MALNAQQRQEAMDLYRDPMWSASRIGAKFGVSRNAIIGIAFRSGVSAPADRQRGYRVKSERNRHMQALRHKAGLTWAEIAEQYGVSWQRAQYIVNRLDKQDVANV
jgi:hypothetical protein